MKKAILLSILIISLLACRSNKTRDASLVGDSISFDTLQKRKDSIVYISNDRKSSSKQDVAEKLLGVWIVKGSETGNAIFLLRDSVIYYPETDASYPYKIEADTLIVKYDDYIQHLGFKFLGNDTLVLVGEDGPNTFYRVKK